ncbi:TIGR03503 family protein [Shewanella mangrovi]|uniref:TIGR03503 family protein n=1 Tax=Shewanella mangrovi TaxID=1515746 RepID=UPI001F4D0A02|nr:TIGR03503 family protein [Shewanella mangrovi]
MTIFRGVIWCVLALANLAVMSAYADTVPIAQASELKNRFRIDHMVEEVTLVVQRDFGSAPVVIIQPDGSKWYSSRHPDTVKWTDSESGDLINIKNPTPGPWQLTGKIVEGSKIVRLSKLGIEVEPFPQPLYQGERLKLKAWLTGDDLKMRLPGLAYMVQWNATFASQQDKEDANFAAGTFGVGNYQDNGADLDERPDDGTFTSNINLNQPWGHYLLTIQAQNEVFQRQYQQPFVLSKIPADIQVVEPENPREQAWELALVADAEQLKLEESYFELSVVGPAGFQSNLSERLEGAAKKELVLTDVRDYGSYRIKGTLFSTTKTGREIVVALPERFFNYVEPPAPPPSAEEMAARAAAVAEVEEASAKSSALTLVIIGNLVLLILGAGLLLFLRKRQTLKLALAAAEKSAAEEQGNANQQKTGIRDIDLTMPDDNE